MNADSVLQTLELAQQLEAAIAEKVIKDPQRLKVMAESVEVLLQSHFLQAEYEKGRAAGYLEPIAFLESEEPPLTAADILVLMRAAAIHQRTMAKVGKTFHAAQAAYDRKLRALRPEEREVEFGRNLAALDSLASKLREGETDSRVAP